MQCKYCLAEIEDDVTICPLCGKELKEAEETAEVAAAETEEAVTEETEQNSAEETESEEDWEEEDWEDEEEEEEIPAPKKKSIWWKILLAVVGVVLLALAMTFVILNSLGLTDKLTAKVNNTFHSLKFWREEDLYYKKSYTVKDEKAEKNISTVVATAGDQTLTSGELQAFYWMTVYDFLDYYGSYLSYIGVDVSIPLSEQIYDEATGMTYEQMFLDNALKSWHRYAVLIQLSQEEGFTLTAEQQEEMDAFEARMNALCTQYGYTDIEEFVDAEFFPGGSMDSYLTYNRTCFVALAYYDTLYEGLMPAADEIEAYFKEHEAEFAESGITKEAGNYYNVRHILIAADGGAASGEYTDEDWANWKASADSILADFLATDGTEEGFAALANELSVDSGSNTTGGLYENLTKDTSFVEEFKAWYLDETRKPGDTGIVKTEHGYHIMYFSGSTPIWEYEAKAMALSDNTNKLLEEAQAKYPMSVAYKKITLGNVNLAGE